MSFWIDRLTQARCSRLTRIAALILLPAIAVADAPRTRPSGPDALRAQIVAQQAEIATLRAQNRTLAAKARWLTHHSAPGTRPAISTTGVAESANDHRIIFVFDASGSMIDEWDAMREELLKAVDGLGSQQSFDLWAATGDRAESAFGGSPVTATPENKRHAIAFLNGIAAQGNSASIGEALERAFRAKSDAIWLLFYGPFHNPSTIVKIVRDGEARHATPLHTCVWKVDHGDPDDAAKFLLDLASENGGICIDKEGRLVTRDTLHPKPADPAAPPTSQPSIFDLRR